MSGADLFEDGFPHSTPEGYRMGCRGRACPGLAENGITCADATSRYHGDYGFRKKVDAGMSPAEIVAAEKAEVKAVPKPKPAAKLVVEPLSDEALLAAEAVDVEEVPESPEVPGASVPYEKHGTPKGYYSGCRLKGACPGVERAGKSCNQAILDYQHERKAIKARRADANAAARDALEDRRAEAQVDSEPDGKLDEVSLSVGESDAEFAAGVARGVGSPSGDTLSVDELVSEVERLRVENARLLKLTGEETDTILALRAEIERLQRALDGANANANVNAAGYDEVLSDLKRAEERLDEVEAERDRLRAGHSEPVVELEQTTLRGDSRVSITITIGGEA